MAELSPTTSSTAESLSAEVLAVIGVISEQLRTRFAKGGDPELGFVALATLRHLVRHGQRSVSDLARGEGVTTQAISLRMSPLLKAGLVAQSKDPHDRRRTLVEATERGREAVIRSQERVLTALENGIGALTTRERAALIQALPALERLAATLHEETM